jgi:hypothetical protein
MEATQNKPKRKLTAKSIENAKIRKAIAERVQKGRISLKQKRKMERDAQRAAGEIKLGRPPIDLEPEEIRKMAMYFATVAEVADMLHVSESFLREKTTPEGKPYLDFYREGRTAGKLNIKKVMTVVALKGNPTMLKWVSANECGYREHSEVTGADGAPLLQPPNITVVFVDGKKESLTNNPPTITMEPAQLQEQSA